MIGFLSSFFLITSVLISCVQQAILDSVSSTETTVILTNVIYRHGDRTPTDSYPTDPYGNLSLWPVGWGELTNRGKQQEYRLGQYLRYRYSGLLDTKYSPKDIYVLSTDINRAHMSALCNLAGLYPPMGDQVWNEYIRWQPIPVHSVPAKDDYLLLASKRCRAYHRLMKALMHSPVVQDFDEAHYHTYEWITAHSGQVVSSANEAALFYDIFLIQTANNFTLPAWANHIFPRPLREIAEFAFSLFAYSSEMQKFQSGPLLGEMVVHMTEKSKGRLVPDRKMFMYSAHDITILNFLRLLGFVRPFLPQYAALVMVELRRHDHTGEFFVQVFYKDGLDAHAVAISAHGCDILCPLDEFLGRTAPHIPKDWERECNTHRH